jgi:hypothetical protein
VDAGFTTFRAEGAFLVSADWHARQVGKLEIIGECGRTCRIAVPWSDGVQVESRGGEVVTTTEWQPGIVQFDTVAGETYRLAPGRSAATK